MIVAFGQRATSGSTYGVLGFSGVFLSIANIKTAVQNYGDGYYGCSNSNTHLNVVVGTSNHGSTVTSTHGTKWGNMISDIDTYLGSKTTRVVVTGGSDIELAWSSPSTANNWLDSYVAATSRHFFDFGDANGCPYSSHNNDPCSNGWNQSNVLSVSWRSQSTHTVFPLPIQYNELGHNADQWEQIDLYSVTLPRGAMNMRGSLTQHHACDQRGGCSGTDNTAQQGWTFLHDALNSHGSTAQNLNWATDIRWGWGSQA